jgi:hypothetical protein
MLCLYMNAIVPLKSGDERLVFEGGKKKEKKITE